MTQTEHSIRDHAVHPDAWKVLRRLHQAGHTAYLVGGTVRDLYLGRVPKDFDVATTAKPNEIKRLFRNAFMIGRRFRLAHIKFYDSVIEVATFRQETDRFEEPSPETGEARAIRIYGTPEEDARRRDFTINGLFYDPFRAHVIDYVGGLVDMEKRIVRTIAPPDASYEEDPARMIRAVRAAARLGFAIEADTGEAIIRHREAILRCPKARLLEELMILLKYNSAERSLRLLWNFGLMEYILPMHHAYLLRRNNLPLHPPNQDVLFDLVSMLDLESAAPDPSVIFSLILFPFVLERLDLAPKLFWSHKSTSAVITAVESIFDEFSKSVDISKRFRGRALEILTAQPRLVLRGSNIRPDKLAQKPYFLDSFMFFKIASRAVDFDTQSDIAFWEKHKPKSQPPRHAAGGDPSAAVRPEPHGAPPPGRRRHRRRRHRGRPPPGPAQNQTATQ
ncbi:MAG: hypothetical protein A3G34_14425 [Candidatus Lindowbacteria bacterium RIFCSPLOWO2_12_FULL_62_27]|nr:MAG: hypothetical protein A3I06_16900 [Candidatus Lindowbacteria bacterium RIFCSPLOWO2_02_FULL_62_12]OGH62756.1 MAG: hypothetical protein A3G34_14425 [Candidatus Lindowbacteria bacterium RIFCSPLOWO2_12_FULL_62_27]